MYIILYIFTEFILVIGRASLMHHLIALTTHRWWSSQGN